MQSFFLSTFTPAQLLTYQVKTVVFIILSTFVVLEVWFQFFCLWSVFIFVCKSTVNSKKIILTLTSDKGWFCKVARWGFLQELWLQALRRKDSWDLWEKSWKLSLFGTCFTPAEYASQKAKNDKIAQGTWSCLVSPQLKLPINVSALLWQYMCLSPNHPWKTSTACFR